MCNIMVRTLVFEYVDADLGKIFRTNQFFTELHVQYMLYQILLGLKYMHGNFLSIKTFVFLFLFFQTSQQKYKTK